MTNLAFCIHAITADVSIRLTCLREQNGKIRKICLPRAVPVNKLVHGNQPRGLASGAPSLTNPKFAQSGIVSLLAKMHMQSPVTTG